MREGAPGSDGLRHGSPQGSARTPGERLWDLQFWSSDGALGAAAEALLQSRHGGDPELEAWSLLTMGYCELRSAPRERAEESLRQALRAFRALGQRRGELLARCGLARVAMIEGRYDAALKLFQRIVLEAGDRLLPIDRFHLLNGISGCHFSLGNTERALYHLVQATQVLRGLDARPQLATLLCNLGYVLVAEGDYDGAAEALDEAAPIAAQLQQPDLSSGIRANRAECHLRLGELDRALALVPAMLEDARSGLAAASSAHTCCVAAEILLAAGRLEEARAVMAPIDEAARTLGTDELAAGRALVSGQLLVHEGKPEQGIVELETALPLAERSRSLSLEARLRRHLARACASAGRHEEAVAHLERLAAIHEARERSSVRAKYVASHVRNELERARAERDESERRRHELQQAKEEVERLNRELSEKLVQIEALQQTLREQAIRDPLTGLFNRRYLEEAGRAALSSAERRGRQVTLCLLDLDQLKLLNDRYGHLTGDLALQAFADVLLRNTRGSDIACRFGGDEFCLVFTDSTLADATRRLEEILALARETPIVNTAAVRSGLSFSAGLAEYPTHGADLAALLARADRALYDAKQAGRDRVHGAGSPLEVQGRLW